jgi:hypothetical protein
MAERVGFEPTIPVKVYTLSKRAPSATRPSLQRKVGTASLYRLMRMLAQDGFRSTHAQMRAQTKPAKNPFLGCELPSAMVQRIIFKQFMSFAFISRLQSK